MKKVLLVYLVLLAVLFFTGCAADPNTAVNTEASNGTIAGFWLGLWHGVSITVMFGYSLFSDNVGIYEVHNNGGWYNFGFVLGLIILFGGSASASSKKSK